MSQTKAQLVEGLNINTSAPADALVIDSAGNMGVGTASPGTQLEIAGSASTLLRLDSSNGNGGVIRIRNGGADKHFFGSAADFMTGGTANQTAIRSNSDILFGISGNEKARVDSSGRLLVGTSSSPTAGSGVIAKSVIQGNTSNSAGAGFLSLQRGQAAASIGTNETLGQINFSDSSGFDYAIIKGQTAAAGGTNDYPGKLIFGTTADGASTTTDRMTIDSSGTIICADGVSGVTTSANDVLTIEATDVASKTRALGIYGKSSITSTFEAFQLRHGGDQNITFKYNGAATFAEQITAKDIEVRHTNDTSAVYSGLAANGTNTSRINGNGNATFAGNLGLTGKGGTDTAFYIFDTSASNATSVGINANGSATFAGGAFAIASDGDITTNIRGHGHLELDSTGSFGSPKIKLFGNTGAATFNGVLKVNRTASGDGCFNADLNGVTKASITSAGAATFGSGTPGSSGATSTLINGSGGIETQASSGNVFIGRTSSTAATSSIDHNGNAQFSGSVTASNVSDIRFKANITDANPQLADAVALGSQLKNFDWNDDAPLNEELRAKRFLGLVAQEAEKVCPGLTYTVSRTKQGAELTPETTDAEGIVTPATYEELDDSFKAINHDILVMKLLGAVAELSAKVAVLEAG